MAESESSMSKNKSKQTFKEALEEYCKYEINYNAKWMMPREEVRNTRTCILLTNGSFNIIAYMNEKGGKKRVILINKDGVFKVKEDLSGKLAQKPIPQFLNLKN